MRSAGRPGTIGYVCACVLALAACGSGNPAPSEGQASVVLTPTDVAVVEQRQLRVGPSIAGRLEPREQATIVAQVGGAVREVSAELGDRVHRGQLLARIDAGGLGDAVISARAAVRSAQQAASLAKHQAQRSRELFQSGALAEHQLEVDRNAAELARSQLAQARAQLQSARQTLSETRIRSPMDGVVSVQSVHDGDVVTPGGQLYRIIDPSSLRVDASVPTSALNAIDVGTPVEFQIHGQPGERFEGVITRIAPAANATTGQIAILVSIPNSSGRLVAGLFADGRVITESEQALSVPVSAIDWTHSPPTVTAIRQGKAQRVQVELGATDQVQQLIAIRSGLHAGEQVVVGPARDIEPGTPVQLKAPGQQPPTTAAAGPRAPDHTPAWRAQPAGSPP